MNRENELSLFRQRMEDFITSVDLMSIPKHEKNASSASQPVGFIQKRKSSRSSLGVRRLQHQAIKRPISHFAKDVLTANDYRLCRAGLKPQKRYKLDKTYGLIMLASLFDDQTAANRMSQSQLPEQAARLLTNQTLPDNRLQRQEIISGCSFQTHYCPARDTVRSKSKREASAQFYEHGT